MITNIGDNHDCCCLKVATHDANGLWQSGALKHNMVTMNTYHFVSPLYTVARYSGELKPDEMILKEIKEYIDNSEEKGGIVNEYLFGSRTITELREFLLKNK